MSKDVSGRGKDIGIAYTNINLMHRGLVFDVSCTSVDIPQVLTVMLVMSIIHS